MKTVSKTILVVDYHELNKTVNDFLKSKGVQTTCPYECVAYEEWSNGSNHSFCAGVEPGDGEYEYDIEDILKGDFQYKLTSILDWMAAEGVIEKGEYLVNVYW
jgi:hypothetical protein